MSRYCKLSRNTNYLTNFEKIVKSARNKKRLRDIILKFWDEKSKWQFSYPWVYLTILACRTTIKKSQLWDINSEFWEKSGIVGIKLNFYYNNFFIFHGGNGLWYEYIFQVPQNLARPSSSPIYEKVPQMVSEIFRFF